MTKLRDFFAASIRRRIIFSFGIVIALVAVVALMGYYQLGQIIRSSKDMIPESSQMGHMQDFALALSSLDSSLERYFVIGGEQSQQDVLHDLDDMAVVLAAFQEAATEKASPAPGELTAIDGLKQATAALDTEIRALLAIESMDLSAKETNERIISIYANIDTATQLHQELSAGTLAQLQGTALGQQRVASGVITQFLVLGILVALIAVFTSLFVTRSIAVPLADLAETSRKIAGGDLGARATQVASRDEVGVLATNFNAMAERVTGLLENLEERSRALETSAQVSRRLSTILDQKELVAEVVSQVQDAFNYYHAHIYLLDAAGEYLVMAGGTGEAGREMLAGGHRLPWGKGLVGRAAETHVTVLVPDVSQTEGWLPNPLLPETRSEIAVPILAGERVLGVLDVQHDVAGGLGQADADLLESIAGQVAVALQNTRLFAETRQRAEYEARLNLINQNIQRAASLESLLQVAARELGQAIGAQRVSVQLAPSRDGHFGDN